MAPEFRTWSQQSVESAAMFPNARTPCINNQQEINQELTQLLFLSKMIPNDDKESRLIPVFGLPLCQK